MVGIESNPQSHSLSPRRPPIRWVKLLLACGLIAGSILGYLLYAFFTLFGRL